MVMQCDLVTNMWIFSTSVLSFHGFLQPLRWNQASSTKHTHTYKRAASQLYMNISGKPITIEMYWNWICRVKTVGHCSFEGIKLQGFIGSNNGDFRHNVSILPFPGNGGCKEPHCKFKNNPISSSNSRQFKCPYMGQRIKISM